MTPEQFDASIYQKTTQPLSPDDQYELDLLFCPMFLWGTYRVTYDGWKERQHQRILYELELAEQERKDEERRKLADAYHRWQNGGEWLIR